MAWWALAWAVALGGPGVAVAQYKVVGADGRVTYTDRPPADAPARRLDRPFAPAAQAADDGEAAVDTVPAPGVQRWRAYAGQAAAGAALPSALREAVRQFPVMLHARPDCAPCMDARALLARRGVPHLERSVTTEADAQALLRLSGARSLPTLTIGRQVLVGWQPTVWSETLDLAGYPASSQLPAGWTPPPPRPLAEPQAPSRPSARNARPVVTPLAGATRAPDAGATEPRAHAEPSPATDPAAIAAPTPAAPPSPSASPGQPNIRF